jgi:uncharacterized oligopeptide transporter (OPT) family protein
MSQHKPFVPPGLKMSEFTLRATLIGLVMCVVLGAANAYLGLKAGSGDRDGGSAAVQGLHP